jgi:hypothetical protein
MEYTLSKRFLIEILKMKPMERLHLNKNSHQSKRRQEINSKKKLRKHLKSFSISFKSVLLCLRKWYKLIGFLKLNLKGLG